MRLLRPRPIRNRSVKRVVADELRAQEAAQIIRWMDDALGSGWRRRMEKVDRVMTEDNPRIWLRREKLPTKAALAKLREYAQRFGYGKITTAECRANLRAGKFADVAAALDTLENPPPSPEACLYNSDTPTPVSPGRVGEDRA
jgi:hypothetical protein